MRQKTRRHLRAQPAHMSLLDLKANSEVKKCCFFWSEYIFIVPVITASLIGQASSSACKESASQCTHTHARTDARTTTDNEAKQKI